MSILSTDLQQWSPANVPTADTTTTGGAISTTGRPTLTQWAANNVAQVVSDGADTRTVTITGRLTTGVVDTEALVLNGTTAVTGAKTWERVLSAVIGATDAARTVSVKEGAGGTVRATIGPNETTRHILFQQSSSTTAIRNYYEKVFWKNANGSLSLLSAQVTLTADPSAKITIGLATAVNDSATVANRLTAPAGVSFVDDNVAQNVPGTNLAAGAAIGVWINLTLAANDTALKSSFTTQLAGQTT